MANKSRFAVQMLSTADDRADADADAVLRAAGSSIRHYTMPGTRAAICDSVEGIAERARAEERAAVVAWLADQLDATDVAASSFQSEVQRKTIRARAVAYRIAINGISLGLHSLSPRATRDAGLFA